MTDKIKGYINAAILLVIAVVGAVIFGLQKKLNKANSKVGQLEATNKLAEILVKKEEAEDDAVAKENEYRRVRDAFLNNSDGAGGDTKA